MAALEEASDLVVPELVSVERSGSTQAEAPATSSAASAAAMAEPMSVRVNRI
jgi:hypothetical protein